MITISPSHEISPYPWIKVPAFRFSILALAGVHLPPAFPTGQYVVLNDIDNGFSRNITDPNDAIGNNIFGDSDNNLDATGFVDLFDPNGTVDDLNFHWVITYPGVAGTYSDQGITGYFSPVLHTAPASLATATTLAKAPTFTLTVTSKKDPSLVTVISIHAEVASSGLLLSMYSSCIGQTHACPGCQCTVTNALSTTEPH